MRSPGTWGSEAPLYVSLTIETSPSLRSRTASVPLAAATAEVMLARFLPEAAQGFLYTAPGGFRAL